MKKVINNLLIKSIEIQVTVTSLFANVDIFNQKVSDSGKKCANKSIFTVENNVDNLC
jgi:hypothetical protein